jgi:hypothetical protein
VARTHDVTVVIAPALRGAFEGRREVSLGVPLSAGIGDVVETLLRLYPRARKLVAAEQGGNGGLYLHLAMDEQSAWDLARGGGGLSSGRKLYAFALSRASPGGRAGVQG